MLVRANTADLTLWKLPTWEQKTISIFPGSALRKELLHIILLAYCLYSLEGSFFSFILPTSEVCYAFLEATELWQPAAFPKIILMLFNYKLP